MPLWMPYDRLYFKFQLDRVETPAAGTAGVAGNRPDCNRSIVVVVAPHVAARSRRSHPRRTCKWAAPGRSLLPRTHARTRLGSPPPRLQFGQWWSGGRDSSEDRGLLQACNCMLEKGCKMPPLQSLGLLARQLACTTLPTTQQARSHSLSTINRQATTQRQRENANSLEQN